MQKTEKRVEPEFDEEPEEDEIAAFSQELTDSSQTTVETENSPENKKYGKSKQVIIKHINT